MPMTLRRTCLAACAAFALALGWQGGAMAQGTIRIGMTAADIPLTHGQPDQGFEGNRFTAIPLYDALIAFDLSRADRPTPLVAGLATEWAVDPANRTRWVFKLRPGVVFHDGSPFNADAVVWNVRKVLDREAPHYDSRQVGLTASRMPALRSAEKIDDLTVALITSEPDSFLPYNITNLFMASPAQWQKKFDAASSTNPGATPADKAMWSSTRARLRRGQTSAWAPASVSACASCVTSASSVALDCGKAMR